MIAIREGSIRIDSQAQGQKSGNGARSIAETESSGSGQVAVAATRVRFGPFEVDLPTCELRKFGIRVKLQYQPFTLLATLLERPGELVARQVLQERIWGKATVVDFDHGLGTALNKLREALGDSPAHPLYIETVPRLGYRFIAPVQAIEPAAPPRAVVEVTGNQDRKSVV